MFNMRARQEFRVLLPGVTGGVFGGPKEIVKGVAPRKSSWNAALQIRRSNKMFRTDTPSRSGGESGEALAVADGGNCKRRHARRRNSSDSASPELHCELQKRGSPAFYGLGIDLARVAVGSLTMFSRSSFE